MNLGGVRLRRTLTFPPQRYQDSTESPHPQTDSGSVRSPQMSVLPAHSGAPPRNSRDSSQNAYEETECKASLKRQR